MDVSSFCRLPSLLGNLGGYPAFSVQRSVCSRKGSRNAQLCLLVVLSVPLYESRTSTLQHSDAERVGLRILQRTGRIGHLVLVLLDKTGCRASPPCQLKPRVAQSMSGELRHTSGTVYSTNKTFTPLNP